MPAPREDNLLGRLALHYKLLTRDQLVESLQQQEREGHRRRIGDIWIENGWLTAARFQQLLVAQAEYEKKLATQPMAATPAPAAAPRPAPPAAAPLASAAGALAPLAEGPAPTAELLGGATAAAAPTLARAAAAPAAPAAPVAPAPPRTAPAAAPAAAPPVVAPAAAGARTGMARLLALAVSSGASDLHVHAGMPPRLRIHGDFRSLDEPALTREQTPPLLAEVLGEERTRLVEEKGQIDFAYTLPGVGRFRCNVYRQQRGWDGVFRVIPPEPPSLSDLGMPLDLARFANYHQGLVLITGPTGSGKSSTLAALVRIVNEERRDHIITIEDPVEFVHRPQRCVINQRQVGSHTGSFSRALRAALREDPDVIVVGELRDLETISLALTAAETGHLVLATLHTQNAINTINRLIGVFPPAQQSQIRTMVSESLRAVTSQRLVSRADGRGRVAALEIMVANKAVANLIRESKTFQLRSVLQTGGAQGMKALDTSLEELVKQGLVTREEAARHAEDPRRFAPRAAPPAGPTTAASPRPA